MTEAEIRHDLIRSAAALATLLLDRGELYVSAAEGRYPEVWTRGGAYVARFMYRADADAFVAVFNIIQLMPKAGQ